MSRNEAELVKLAAGLPAVEGGKHVAIACDVSQNEQVEAAIRQVEREYGRVDILVNCAGVADDCLFVKSSAEAMHNVVGTNLLGAMYLSKAVLRPMMKQRYGRIINVGSVIGLMGNTGQAAYSASKAGLIGLTKALAVEYGPRGITVNAVAPGYIDTEMLRDVRDKIDLTAIPLRRLGRAEEVADVVSFLVGSDYLTGQVIVLDGGLSSQI